MLMARIYENIVRTRMQSILDSIKLNGLTKLVEEEQPVIKGILLKAPGLPKNRKKQKKVLDPYLADDGLSFINLPEKLITKEGESPKIVQAYAPIRFLMPISKKETLDQLKSRIEKESMKAVKSTRSTRKKENLKNKINAFYVDDLHYDYILPKSTKQGIPISGDNFLDRTARDILVPRVVFNLCLFNIEQN